MFMIFLHNITSKIPFILCSLSKAMTRLLKNNNNNNSKLGLVNKCYLVFLNKNIRRELIEATNALFAYVI